MNCSWLQNTEKYRQFSLEEMKEHFNFTEVLPESSWLILKWDKDHFWLDFALVRFESQMDDFTEVEIIWHGSGPTGGLRELRHSWFSEYIFYLNGKAVTNAINELSKYYDDMK